MDYSTIATIATLILAGLAIFSGGKLVKVKKKFHRAIDLLNAVQQALADNRLTNKEISNIVDKAKAILN